MAPRENVKVVEKIDLEKLIRDHIKKTDTDESFFIADVGDIVQKFILWNSLMPRIKPFFAFKCNNLPPVVGTLAALGAGYDCASSGEIERVLDMGVGPDKIVFAQTVKPVSHINFAKSNNVRLMTFDNEEELYKVKKNFPEAELLLRLRFDPKTSHKIGFGEKFGCMPGEKTQFLLRKAREVGLNVKGIAFHIGAGCLEYQIFAKAIEDSAAAFDYGNSIGLKMDLLDIGGGFPGFETKTITNLAEVINERLDKYFPDPNVKVISEPGTFFADSSFTLVANAHSKNIKTNEKGEEVVHYYITDGIYQSFNMTSTHDVPVSVKTLDDLSGKPMKNTVIWGRACDPHDIVKSNFKLPEIQCGDWLVFPNAGAYSITTSTLFNGFPNHPVYYFIEKEMKEKLMKMKLMNIELPYDFED